jgi:putative two-component system response regulator
LAPTSSSSNTTILLVDDDDAFRRSTARLLTSHGYPCLEAASSAEARLILRAELGITAVLCDITMPGASGLTLLRELTADFAGLAVVMTTGIDDPRVAEVAFDNGAFGYLTKPFDANELLISLASALKRRDLESAQRRHVRELEQTIARTQTLAKVFEGLEHDPVNHADDTVDRLALALSLRDEETGRHIERMSRYSVVLAAAVGYTELSPEDTRVATALHDVGKIGIPDGILLKPGALSRDEYTAMQRHAQIGYQLLAGSTSTLLQIAGAIALDHHEWWDGGGYPRGLQGEEIPEIARIAGIADVFDALTSNRVYRTGLSFDDAIAIMVELRGRQFEPRLLDAFLGCLDEIGPIREAYPDLLSLAERIRVLVVDDHEIFAHSLVRLLESKPEVKVAGVAGTVADGVAAALAYTPDVILMDFELPDGDGTEAAEQIKALTPEVKVVMLTARTDEPAVARAIAAGCSGFVNKSDSVDELLKAIVAAHEGESMTAPLRRTLGRV